MQTRSTTSLVTYCEPIL